jgi:hypothetical protein
MCGAAVATSINGLPVIGSGRGIGIYGQRMMG